MPKLIDLRGKRFGRLLVAGRKRFAVKKKQTYWIVRCDCGTEKIVDGRNLRRGDSQSCGCLHSEVCVPLARKLGQNNKGRKHYHRRQIKNAVTVGVNE